MNTTLPLTSPLELPERIETTEQLDELLSRPAPATVEFLRRLDGDLIVIGAGGKVGPTICRLARRAIEAAGVRKRVIAVDLLPMPALAALGIETVQCDLLDWDAVRKLPKAENVIFMAGRKFGSTGAEHLTWAINVVVPYHVASAFTHARIASFSTGCVYPVTHLFTGGSRECDPPDPVGEYAMSCLGRERMFDRFAETKGERVVHIRLNYAVELRYGVLFDIATRIWKGEPVDLTTGFANVVWQGDVGNYVLRSLALAASPSSVLNVSGPEAFSVRQVAREMAAWMGKDVTFSGEENGRGYLNNSARCHGFFGYPTVPLQRIIAWTADWVMRGGESLGKPTHFETQDGKY